MGGGTALPEKGGKRGLDFDLNLVPFIDLLSCCIAFLLITAAWTQLARIETAQKIEQGGGGGGGGEQTDKLQLVVFDWGYEILPPDAAESCSVPNKEGKYQVGALTKLVESYKKLKPNLTVAAVAALDGLDFNEVVKVMDVCVSAGLINVSLGQIPGGRPAPPPCPGG